MRLDTYDAICNSILTKGEGLNGTAHVAIFLIWNIMFYSPSVKFILCFFRSIGSIGGHDEARVCHPAGWSLWYGNRLYGEIVYVTPGISLTSKVLHLGIAWPIFFNWYIGLHFKHQHAQTYRSMGWNYLSFSKLQLSYMGMESDSIPHFIMGMFFVHGSFQFTLVIHASRGGRLGGKCCWFAPVANKQLFSLFSIMV